MNEISVRAYEPGSTDVTHSLILMPEQGNWVNPIIHHTSLKFSFHEIKTTDSYLILFYEVNSWEFSRHPDEDEGHINTEIQCKHSNAKCLKQMSSSQSDFLSSLHSGPAKYSPFRSKYWPLCLKCSSWITSWVDSIPSWYVCLYKNVWVVTRSLRDFPSCLGVLSEYFLS